MVEFKKIRALQWFYLGSLGRFFYTLQYRPLSFNTQYVLQLTLHFCTPGKFCRFLDIRNIRNDTWEVLFNKSWHIALNLLGSTDSVKVIPQKLKLSMVFLTFPESSLRGTVSKTTIKTIGHHLALINRAEGLYGRILTEVVSTDRTQ